VYTSDVNKNAGDVIQSSNEVITLSNEVADKRRDTGTNTGLIYVVAMMISQKGGFGRQPGDLGV